MGQTAASALLTAQIPFLPASSSLNHIIISILSDTVGIEQLDYTLANFTFSNVPKLTSLGETLGQFTDTQLAQLETWVVFSQPIKSRWWGSYSDVQISGLSSGSG